jgi:hypothetical protein
VGPSATIDGNLTPDQVGRECRQSIILALDPAILDRGVTALLDVAIAFLY